MESYQFYVSEENRDKKGEQNVSYFCEISFAVFLFGLSGACGILCTMTDITLVQKYSFMALMIPGMGATVISAVAVEAYPTSSRYLHGSPYGFHKCQSFSSPFIHHRGMGISIALMFGRLGAISGANIVAILIKNYCEQTFYLSGSSILGKVVFNFLSFHS